MARPIRTASVDVDLTSLFSMLLLCGSSYAALPDCQLQYKAQQRAGGVPGAIPLQAIIEFTTTQAKQSATYTRDLTFDSCHVASFTIPADYMSTPAYRIRQVTLSPSVNSSDKVKCLHNNQEKLTAYKEGNDVFKQRDIRYINFSMALKNFLIFLSCSRQTNQGSFQVH